MGRLNMVLAAAIWWAAPAAAQTLANQVEDPASPTFKQTLQETLEDLANKVNKNKAQVSTLINSGSSVQSVSATSPLSSSGGQNPNISFTGQIPESSVTNLPTDLANRVLKTGDTMTGQLTLSGSTLTITGNAFSVGASSFTVSGGSATVAYQLSLGSLVVNNGITASSGTFTATGNTQYSLQTSSGISVNGQVVAPYFVGDGHALTGLACVRGTNTQAVRCDGSFNASSGPYSVVSGGYTNTADVDYSVVSGGYTNTAEANAATVSGGDTNVASALQSTVGGGHLNTASNTDATVSGGINNQATKNYSTVPGGRNNAAAGVASFAAGGGCTASGNSTTDGSFCYTVDLNGGGITSNPKTALFNVPNGFDVDAANITLYDASSNILFSVDNTSMSIKAGSIYENGNLVLASGDSVGGDLSGTLPNPTVIKASSNSGFTVVSTETVNGLQIYGAVSAATLRAAACGTGNHCLAYNTDDSDLYTSTASNAGAWRNTRTGTAP